MLWELLVLGFLQLLVANICAYSRNAVELSAGVLQKIQKYNKGSDLILVLVLDEDRFNVGRLAHESQGGGLLGKCGIDVVAPGALAVLSHLTEDDICVALVNLFTEQSESEAWRHHDAAGRVVHVPVREGTSLPGVDLVLSPAGNRHSRGDTAAIFTLVESRWCEAVRIADVLTWLAVGLEHIAGHSLEGFLGNIGRAMIDGLTSLIPDVFLEATSLALAKVGLDIEDLCVEIINLLVESEIVIFQVLNTNGHGLRLLLGEGSSDEADDRNVGFHL